MDAPYQAQDITTVMGAGSGGDSIFGMMPRNGLEVKRECCNCARFRVACMTISQ